MSQKEINKQQRERYYLERFLEKSKLSAKILRHGDHLKDEPDFFIEIDGEEVGLELTELFKDQSATSSALKKYQSESSKYMLALAKAYYEISSIPIDVDLVTLRSLQELAIPKLATFLSEVANKKSGDEGICREFAPGVLLFVRKRPASVIQSVGWRHTNDRTGFVKQLSSQLLQIPIDAKAANLSRYTKSAAKMMLLIYADRTWAYGMLEVVDPKANLAGFEKVLLFIYPESPYQVLQCN